MPEPQQSPTPPGPRLFRLSRAAYLVVLLLAIGVTAAVQQPVLATVYVVPIAAACYVYRVGTRVDQDGLVVRALLGSRAFTWDQVRGLTVVERNVYAVVDGGLVRLPCVRIADLHELSAASSGRLPELARPVPKFAPGRRSRR